MLSAILNKVHNIWNLIINLKILFVNVQFLIVVNVPRILNVYSIQRVTIITKDTIFCSDS